MLNYLSDMFGRFFPAIMVLLLFLVFIFAWNIILVPIIRKIAKRIKSNWLSTLINAYKKPINILLIVSAVFFAINAFLAPENTIIVYIMPFYRSFAVIVLAWGLINAKDVIRNLFSSGEANARSETIILFFTRIYIVVIVVFAILMVLSDLKFDVTGILTGLGLGSLTIALAAQDAASNFFSGVIIIIERPFEVGDWISADVIEGEVEDITFRSTKVRTLDGSLTIVPNSKLSGSALTNWTKLEHRLSRFILGLTYDTSAQKLKKVSDDIKEMLINFNGIEKESVEICFDAFNNSSIDIMVTMYISAIKITEYRSIMSEINYNIMDIMKNNDASFAYPTQSIYIENMPKTQ